MTIGPIPFTGSVDCCILSLASSPKVEILISEEPYIGVWVRVRVSVRVRIKLVARNRMHARVTSSDVVRFRL